MRTEIYECQCAVCLEGKDRAVCQQHHQMNVFLSRLDEQQRRWYVALESNKVGHGGDTQLAQITGLDVETIRRGRREIDDDLQSRPADRIRAKGGGRPSVEKKTLHSKAPLLSC